MPRRQLPRPQPGGGEVPRHKPLRAILLARVSTTHESQDASPDRQIARLRAVASAHDWTIVDVIVERASGRQILDRPPVVRALERICNHEADVLAVDHLSRLGRNAKEALEVLDIVAGAGGQFYDATSKLDTTSPLGRFIFTAFAAVWELETADRRLKVREGLDRARARGTKLGKPFVVPRDVLTRARELRSEGDAEGRVLSWAQIVERLKAEGRGSYSRGAISGGVWALENKKQREAAE